MSEIQDFLEDIGRDMGRTAEQMKPFVEKLHGEWYDTLDSLRGIPAEKWNSFGMPSRLVDVIKQKLGSASGPVPMNIVAEEPVLKLSVEAMPCSANDCIGVNLDEKAAVVASAALDDREIAIRTLLKLTDAVLQNPEQEKTRKIRMSNATFQARCGRYPECIDFLMALGFVKKDDFLILEKAFISRLTDGRRALEHILRSSGFQVPPPPAKFNPYVASISSTAQISTVPTGQIAEQRSQEALSIKQELEEKRKLADQCGGSGMLTVPRVFWQASLGRLEDAISVLQSSVDEEDSNVFMDMLSCMQGSEASQFQSREKMELAQLRKKKIYNVAVLRVNFPNKIVLELSFRPKTSWTVVYDVVESCLAEEAKFLQWYLYDTPPVRKFERNKNTLLSCQLVPGAVVHFGVENRERDLSKLGNCVSQELFQSLPTASVPSTLPADSARTGSGTLRGTTPMGGQSLGS